MTKDKEKKIKKNAKEKKIKKNAKEWANKNSCCLDGDKCCVNVTEAFQAGYEQAIKDIAKMSCFNCKNEHCWNIGTEVRIPIEEMIECWKGE